MKKAVSLLLAMMLLVGLMPLALAEGGGTLKLVTSDDLETMNQHLYKFGNTRTFLQMVGGALYRVAPGEEGNGYRLIAEYAESDPQKMDEEGFVWRIKVKDGMKWANGEPLTAEDFAYSLKMLFDPLLVNRRYNVPEESNIFIKNGAKYFANEPGITWDDVGVKVVENNTLELTLEKAVDMGSVKYCFTGATTMPVYQPLYDGNMNAEKTETKYGTSVERYMSSGPMMLTSWTSGTEFSAVRNPYYPLQDLISLEAVEFTVVPDRGTALQLFETGAVDSATLSVADLEQYRDDPRVIMVKSDASTCLGINLISEENPALGNKSFRQALYYGVNREEVAKIANADPVTWYISAGYISDLGSGLSYRDTPEAKAYLPENHGYNPEKAKALFEQALKELGVDKVSFQLLYQDGTSSRKPVSEYLQSAWPKLFGEDKLSISLQAVPANQLSEQYRDHINNKNSFQTGWIASRYNLLDPASALSEWSAKGHRKKIPYYSEEFTAVFDDLVATSLEDIQARIEKTAKAEAIMLDDAPMIPIYEENSYTIVSDRVHLAFNEYNGVLGMGWIFAQIEK
ncbi:MAG: ABC transporter substrate-binding protein [Christensenellales bacterium]